jgi:hypothetical protein
MASEKIDLIKTIEGVKLDHIRGLLPNEKMF